MNIHTPFTMDTFSYDWAPTNPHVRITRCWVTHVACLAGHRILHLSHSSSCRVPVHVCFLLQRTACPKCKQSLTTTDEAPQAAACEIWLIASWGCATGCIVRRQTCPQVAAAHNRYENDTRNRKKKLWNDDKKQHMYFGDQGMKHLPHMLWPEAPQSKHENKTLLYKKLCAWKGARFLSVLQRSQTAFGDFVIFQLLWKALPCKRSCTIIWWQLSAHNQNSPCFWTLHAS